MEASPLNFQNYPQKGVFLTYSHFERSDLYNTDFFGHKSRILTSFTYLIKISPLNWLKLPPKRGCFCIFVHLASRICPYRFFGSLFKNIDFFFINNYYLTIKIIKTTPKRGVFVIFALWASRKYPYRFLGRYSRILTPFS